MNAKQDNVVELVAVRKIFKDFWNRARVIAVNDLDLQIARGEVFGLLGPNGSGKSTTIKMVLGLLKPTYGVISVFDRPPSDVKTKQRIGFLPEESYLYPFLTAWETLDYYGRLFRQPRPVRRQRIEMLLEMVGLSAVAYRRVGEYSKGMQRRIGLAQALINDPDLLILDEPTSGLDPLGARQFKDLIIQLGQRGKTVILSSHLLDDVEDVCDRVAILYGGRKRAMGSISELLSLSGRTQIIADRLSDQTVNEIRKMVQQREGRELLEVSAPRDRLESLFLRIVDQAQNERVSTGGAVGTGQVARFLRGEENLAGSELLDQLIRADETPSDDRNGDPAAASIEATVDRSMLKDLTEQPEQAPVDPGNAGAEPVEKKTVDHSVLESLMDDDPQEQRDG